MNHNSKISDDACSYRQSVERVFPGNKHRRLRSTTFDTKVYFATEKESHSFPNRRFPTRNALFSVTPHMKGCAFGIRHCRWSLQHFGCFFEIYWFHIFAILN